MISDTSNVESGEVGGKELGGRAIFWNVSNHERIQNESDSPIQIWLSRWPQFGWAGHRPPQKYCRRIVGRPDVAERQLRFPSR